MVFPPPSMNDGQAMWVMLCGITEPNKQLPFMGCPIINGGSALSVSYWR